MAFEIDLRDELVAAFGRAREDLLAARLRRQQKDTPRNRTAERACRTTIDGLLDTYLELAEPADVVFRQHHLARPVEAGRGAERRSS